MPLNPMQRYQRLLEHVRQNDVDLTQRQIAMLATLFMTPGPHTVRDLAATLQVSKPVITRATNTLTAYGLVEREANPHDKRSVFITITPRGRAMAERLL